MNAEAIFFEFDNEASALLAQSTLEELGYTAGLHSEFNHPTLHIQVEHSVLSSALEIAQAHGGRLVEHTSGLTENDAYRQAYDTDDGYISIPAHVVNEDWSELYATNAENADSLYAPDRGADGAAAGDSDDSGNSDNPVSGAAGESDSGNGAKVFDPSDDDYSHFDAGVRL
ncbi:hypothetical protein [Paenibacillus piri]|uniref:DNA/RNA helicase n=1 Tax=Paenibacillus piri TaxID=2547395 RepID=A0A4V2ZTH9_9BACL|nr:hypothetical protein [Paenibacillus piri]TDF97194.1 hypothetical protein E1757_15305 [Paenibacillus piri]